MKKTSIFILTSMLIFIMFTVLSCTNNLEKPSPETIQKDLVGHTLTQGLEPGYYDQSWRWTIEEGQISNFMITDTILNTNDQFVIMTEMKLTNLVNDKAYHAKAKIGYDLLNSRNWALDYIVSEAMTIVKTGKYDNLIKTEEGKCGEGLFAFLDIDIINPTCFNVSNKGDITLEIGYRIFDGIWSKGSAIINAYDNITFECDGFIIDYVEKP